MLFSIVLIWLLVAIAFVVALPALWIFALGFWPEKVIALRREIACGLMKSFLVGLGPLALSVTSISTLSKVPNLSALAVLLGGF
jgi:hypothetical protein